MRALFRPSSTLFAVLTVLPLLLASSTAAARGFGIIPYGWKEKLTFVAATQIENPAGGAYELCKLVKTHHIVFVNAWRSVESYVLAPKCSGEGYLPFSAAQLASAQRNNLVATTIPATPTLSGGEVATGFLALFLVPLGALGLGWLAFDQARRKTKRNALFGNASYFANQVLDVMCHAARVDGKIDAAEIALIQSAGRHFTGTEFTEAQVRRALELSSPSLPAAAFRAFGEGLPHPNRLILMKAALQVIGVDGAIAGEELKFVNSLAAGLGLSQTDVQTILQPAAAASAS